MIGHRLAPAARWRQRQRRRSAKQSNKLALVELPSDEAPQSSTSLDNQGAVHRSDIFLLMSVQGLGRVKTPGKRMHGYFGLVGRTSLV